ncbi:MAG: hypothetical protein OQK55_00755 [Thermoanaerobaculales bacterium]|nr:hypothetical protein [Thermoanaerobaculales bacterium]
MMGKKAGLVLALLMTVTAFSVANDEAAFGDGPYLGLRPPGLTAEVFAPGLIPENEWAGCSGFLNDGTVFVYSSMKAGTDWRFKPTYVMELEDGKWSEPEVAPFSAYMPYNFTVGPAGKTLYFTTLKSPDKSTSMLLEQANIWAVTLTKDGWTEPVMLGASINTEEHYENYPTVARDGTIYYMSRREGTVGKTDIYRSRNRDGKYADAENLGPPVNSVESDQDPFVAPDGSYLIVCLTGREDSFGGYDLFVSFSGEDGTWSEPVNLGEGVNGPGSEFRPYVTADGKYLFFTALDPDSNNIGRIFWVSSEVIRSKRVGQ